MPHMGRPVAAAETAAYQGIARASSDTERHPIRAAEASAASTIEPPFPMGATRDWQEVQHGCRRRGVSGRSGLCRDCRAGASQPADPAAQGPGWGLQTWGIHHRVEA